MALIAILANCCATFVCPAMAILTSFRLLSCQGSAQGPLLLHCYGCPAGMAVLSCYMVTTTLLVWLSSLASLLLLHCWYGCPLFLHCYYCTLGMAVLSCGIFTAVLLAWLSSLATLLRLECHELRRLSMTVLSSELLSHIRLIVILYSMDVQLYMYLLCTRANLCRLTKKWQVEIFWNPCWFVSLTEPKGPGIYLPGNPSHPSANPTLNKHIAPSRTCRLCCNWTGLGQSQYYVQFRVEKGGGETGEWAGFHIVNRD